MPLHIELHEVASHCLPAAVPYALIAPHGYPDLPLLPLCLFLLGGGGNRQNLIEMAPLLERWWSDGSIAPMVLATPNPGMDYYLEDASAGIRWDAFLADEFVPHLRSTCRVGTDASSTAITGISIGGYGALKAAFARPERFCAVAAMQPMIEPGLRDREIGARNRLHHASGGPPQLVGASRDAALFEANNPANRARANAVAIRDAGLAIYVDAGDEDLLNAHDGAEFLHRVLWDLDLSHEYHLVRGADHGGPTLRPRIRAMLGWIGAAMSDLRPAAAEPAAEEKAVKAWLEAGTTGPPPPGFASSKAFVRFLRARLQPVRDRAAQADPTTSRRYGVLPRGADGD